MKRVLVLRMVALVLLGSAILVFASCGAGGKKTTDIVASEPQKDSLAVDEILLPSQMQVKGDVVLIMSANTDTVFYAYGLPDFHFLFRQGIKGNGPDDFLWQNMVQCAPDSIFALDEMGKRSVGVYRVGPQGYTKVRALKNHYSGVCSMVNDSIAVVQAFFWGRPDPAKLYVLNLLSGVRTDSIPMQTYKGSIKLGSMVSSAVNPPLCKGYGKYLAVAYPLMDRIEFYEISPQGKAVFHRAVGKDERLDPALESYGKEEIKSLKSARNFDQAPLYFQNIGYATEHYLFVHNSGGVSSAAKEAAMKAGEWKVSLDVYSWDGKLAGKIRLPFSVIFGMPFAVSEKYRTIYAVDPGRDFDHIYTFKYDLEE